MDYISKNIIHYDTTYFPLLFISSKHHYPCNNSRKFNSSKQPRIHIISRKNSVLCVALLNALDIFYNIDFFSVRPVPIQLPPHILQFLQLQVRVDVQSLVDISAVHEVLEHLRTYFWLCHVAVVRGI